MSFRLVVKDEVTLKETAYLVEDKTINELAELIAKYLILNRPKPNAPKIGATR